MVVHWKKMFLVSVKIELHSKIVYTFNIIFTEIFEYNLQNGIIDLCNGNDWSTAPIKSKIDINLSISKAVSGRKDFIFRSDTIKKCLSKTNRKRKLKQHRSFNKQLEKDEITSYLKRLSGYPKCECFLNFK